MRAHIRFHGGQHGGGYGVSLSRCLSGAKECRRVSGQRGKRMFDRRMKGA